VDAPGQLGRVAGARGVAGAAPVVPQPLVWGESGVASTRRRAVAPVDARARCGSSAGRGAAPLVARPLGGRVRLAGARTGGGAPLVAGSRARCRAVHIAGAAALVTRSQRRPIRLAGGARARARSGAPAAPHGRGARSRCGFTGAAPLI